MDHDHFPPSISLDIDVVQSSEAGWVGAGFGGSPYARQKAADTETIQERGKLTDARAQHPPQHIPLPSQQGSS